MGTDEGRQVELVLSTGVHGRMARWTGVEGVEYGESGGKRFRRREVHAHTKP